MPMRKESSTLTRERCSFRVERQVSGRRQELCLRQRRQMTTGFAPKEPPRLSHSWRPSQHAKRCRIDVNTAALLDQVARIASARPSHIGPARTGELTVCCDDGGRMRRRGPQIMAEAHRSGTELPAARDRR